MFQSFLEHQCEEWHIKFSAMVDIWVGLDMSAGSEHSVTIG